MAYPEFAGVLCLALVALLSLSSVVFYFLRPSLRLHHYHNTHISGYFQSLLVANGIQAFGTVMNFKWAADKGVTSGPFCSAQVHLFNLLFLRLKTTKVGFWCTLVIGWIFVALIVGIGPAALQTRSKGPYFGVTGAWCWITSNYPQEQILLEYLLEYLSAGLGFVLHATIFLRMRGNLLQEDGKWTLRFVPRGESWQLSMRRDIVDSTMLQVVQQMMWCIVYTLLIVPISLARLSQFAGARVPFSITIIAAMIFNMTGFANVLLFASTRKLLPASDELPEFNVARKEIRKSVWVAGGVTPFTITRSETAESFNAERLERAGSANSSRRSSLDEKPTQ
ncbi:Git3 domain-containing protein [Favolaschia claudopus]|uniref:Git3 domain-containing protein n=1 Tax=Favolaschia claudopus TaxID=2862362 RepID=A0AAW0E6B7_9AGAR